jgi:hypothetical protein
MTHPSRNGFAVPLMLFLALGSAPDVHGQSRELDNFDSLSGWRAMPSEGAKLGLVSAKGKNGNALEMDFDLTGTSGYTIAQKDFPLDLPANYQFTFDMRAEAPVNNFEFKLLDSAGNVWWIKKLNIRYPGEWTKQRIKKRHLGYAWGPAGGGEIRRVRSIEFVVSSGTGGKGKVFIDNFRFEPIDDSASAGTRASFETSSTDKTSFPVFDERGPKLKDWRAKSSGPEWVTIDFGYHKEIGGLVIDWRQDAYASDYDILLSDDGKEWTQVYTVTRGNGGRDYIYLHEQEGRFLKLACAKPGSALPYAIAQVAIKGPEFSRSPNDFWSAIAGESPRGTYPQYFLNEQCYWTVVGSSGDTKEALMNEDGAVEVDKTGFTLEPFLFIDNRLVTWNDVTRRQSLLNEYLPIPSVEWTYGGLKLTVQTFSTGESGKSNLMVSYSLTNSGGVSPKGKLFVAIRPYQVNPPWQSLNIQGGASRIDSVREEKGLIYAQDKIVIPMSAPSAFGATGIDGGDIIEYLRRGQVPSSTSAHDPNGFSSAAIEYDFDLPSGSAANYYLSVPFHGLGGSPSAAMGLGAEMYTTLALDATRIFWESKLDKFQVQLPPSAQPVINTIKSNLAYIFINRDGPGIQPGSRSYERSWIRDGALTSTAMLELGINDEVREYLDWYAKYQFPNGKIPCVVDTRGGDPVNEYDSNGEFIFAIMQYFNFTHDTTWLGGKWDNIAKTVRYIQSLRAERKTDVYKNGTPEQKACFGLVPESISHEGYSAKPMHSYWDDFFILRGLKDATTIAGILRKDRERKEFQHERDDFKKDLYASMRLAMKTKGIDYIPGCVELGDFDATSTTIGITPVNELGNIPEPQLHNTFDRYYDYFTKRRTNAIDWKDYTPYENRIIGSFVYLGETKRAHEAMNFFMRDRRPASWNEWAEVVHRDPLTPKYIGDMPHTWVGSDFIRSVRSMFVYEREQDQALVVGAGIAAEWLDDTSGVSVRSLPTYYGPISYTMKKTGKKVGISIDGPLRMPAGKIVLAPPLEQRAVAARINGKRASFNKKKELVIAKLPASIEIMY